MFCTTDTAAYIIAYTDNFQKFSNSRLLSCYAGVALFEHSIGTNIRGKSRVSDYANKKS
ncbi:transposase [Paraflavisolibacter caeni]|uniref:transposase n=1 Tax=Paraflavisolibacter caeni TaxID=2982496 RepID=UPI003C6EA3B8